MVIRSTLGPITNPIANQILADTDGFDPGNNVQVKVLLSTNSATGAAVQFQHRDIFNTGNAQPPMILAVPTFGTIEVNLGEYIVQTGERLRAQVIGAITGTVQVMIVAQG